MMNEPAPAPAPARSDVRQRLETLLAQREFWRALRSRCQTGSNTREIELICDCVAQAADHLESGPTDSLTPAANESLAWCRSVVVKHQAPDELRAHDTATS